MQKSLLLIPVYIGHSPTILSSVCNYIFHCHHKNFVILNTVNCSNNHRQLQPCDYYGKQMIHSFVTVKQAHLICLMKYQTIGCNTSPTREPEVLILNLLKIQQRFI